MESFDVTWIWLGAFDQSYRRVSVMASGSYHLQSKNEYKGCALSNGSSIGLFWKVLRVGGKLDFRDIELFSIYDNSYKKLCRYVPFCSKDNVTIRLM